MFYISSSSKLLFAKFNKFTLTIKIIVMTCMTVADQALFVIYVLCSTHTVELNVDDIMKPHTVSCTHVNFSLFMHIWYYIITIEMNVDLHKAGETVYLWNILKKKKNLDNVTWYLSKPFPFNINLI